MKTIKRAATLITIPLLLLTITLPVSASTQIRPATGTRIVFSGDEVVIRSGDVHNDDFIVFGGGSLIVEQDGTIDGNINVYGGLVTIEGTVTGDIAVYGGSLDLRSTAQANGNILAIGGGVNRESGAEIVGEVTAIGAPFADRRLESRATRILTAILTAFVLGFLATLTYSYIPAPVNRVGSTLRTTPLPSLGIGCGAIIAAPLILLILSIPVITLLLTIPAAILAALIITIAGVFGWLVIGTILGQQILTSQTSSTNPAIAAGLGTFLLSLVVAVLSEIWTVGWLFESITSIIIATSGMGAVLATRFGTQDKLTLPSFKRKKVVQKPAETPPQSEPGKKGLATTPATSPETSSPEPVETPPQPSEADTAPALPEVSAQHVTKPLTPPADMPEPPTEDTPEPAPTGLTQSVALDDRIRTLAALLAATDWPDREQQVKPHEVTPEARALLSHVTDHKDHPAVAYIQNHLNSGTPLDDLFGTALGASPNPQIEVATLQQHLTDFAQAAQLDEFWQTQQAAWDEGKRAVEAHIEGTDVNSFLNLFFGSSPFTYVYYPNPAYPSNELGSFTVDDRACCLVPPRLAWGQNPPWPFDEDREYIIKSGVLAFSDALQAHLFANHPGLVDELAYQASNIPVTDAFLETYPNWPEQLHALIRYGVAAHFVESIDPGAGAASVVFDKRQHHLPQLPHVYELLEQYLEGQANGTYNTLADYLHEFVAVLGQPDED